MIDLVIRGGQVVTPDGVGLWDVAVEGERIAAIAAPDTLPREVGRVIDATGRLVIPGGIDPHVHTHWPIPPLAEASPRAHRRVRSAAPRSRAGRRRSSTSRSGSRA